MTLLYTQSES